MESLKQEIYLIIQNDYTPGELLKTLEPLSQYFDNKQFGENIQIIMEAILKDRNNDGQLTTDDIKLMITDISAITAIVKSLFLALMTIPNISFNHMTGELAYKMIAYVVLCIIPNKLKISWTMEDKKTIIILLDSFYEIISATQIIKKIIKKLRELFTGLFCKKNRQAVIERHLPLHVEKIKSSLR